MADIQMTVGETHETEVFTWTDNGTAVDLTGATVTARIGLLGSAGAAAAGTTTVTNAAAGTLTYKFAVADTSAAPGLYELQFKATFADGSILDSRIITVDVEPAV